MRSGKKATVHLRMLADEKEWYERLAEAEGMSLSAFLRYVMKRGVRAMEVTDEGRSVDEYRG